MSKILRDIVEKHAIPYGEPGLEDAIRAACCEVLELAHSAASVVRLDDGDPATVDKCLAEIRALLDDAPASEPQPAPLDLTALAQEGRACRRAFEKRTAGMTAPVDPWRALLEGERDKWRRANDGGGPLREERLLDDLLARGPR